MPSRLEHTKTTENVAETMQITKVLVVADDNHLSPNIVYRMDGPYVRSISMNRTVLARACRANSTGNSTLLKRFEMP